jgi:hypothetical protein
MTIETIADMVWGLGQDIELKIFDPQTSQKNSSVIASQSLKGPTVVVANAAPKAIATTSSTLKKPPFAPALEAAS